MKQYFEELEKLGRSAIVSLRRLDARQVDEHKEYLEQLRRGDITEQGYKNCIKSLDDFRQRIANGYKSEIAALKEKYSAATEAHLLPTAGRVHKDDLEILRNFKLSDSEFDLLTEKHQDNPVMGRLLEEYRKEHGIDTRWRFQSLEDRKAIFDSACLSVESIINQLDKYSPDREGNLTRRVYSSYHKLQGSDPEALPVPAETEDASTPMSWKSTLL